jgi:hypothetical protein
MAGYAPCITERQKADLHVPTPHYQFHFHRIYANRGSYSMNSLSYQREFLMSLGKLQPARARATHLKVGIYENCGAFGRWLWIRPIHQHTRQEFVMLRAAR